MYTVYDLHLSPSEIGTQFSVHSRYLVLKDDLAFRGYGNTLEDAIDHIGNVGYRLQSKYINLLEFLHITTEVDDLSELKSLYPEHFI